MGSELSIELKKPAKLYKYIPMFEEHLPKVKEMILDRKIWYSFLKNLNDPLEGGLACYTMPHILLNLFERKISKLSVSCFSENRNNMAMWSHYAKGGRGLCVEYDTSSNIFNNIKPVKYIKNLSEIPREAADLNSLAFYKSFDWSYEKEWRLVSEGEGYSKIGELNVTGIYVLSQKKSDVSDLIDWAQQIGVDIHQWNKVLTNPDLSLIFRKFI